FSATPLDGFGRQRQDLHELLVTKLSGHRPKDTGASGVLVLLDEDGGVLVEANIGTVVAADALLAADDNGLDHIALLHIAVGGSLAHGGDDHVTNVAVLALGTAQHTDALDFLGAGVVGNLQITFLLKHDC